MYVREHTSYSQETKPPKPHVKANLLLCVLQLEPEGQAYKSPVRATFHVRGLLGSVLFLLGPHDYATMQFWPTVLLPSRATARGSSKTQTLFLST